MLTTLKAYSAWKSAPLLPLSAFGVETDLIHIRNITGLGPVEADINTSPYGAVDGASFTGSNVGSRNIVITMDLNPDWKDWSMEELRRLIYSYFMTKMPVRLVFMSDDMPAVEISGYVETCEPNPFNKEVEVVTSILCPDPYFTAVNPTVIAGASNAAPTVVNYKGSMETGIHVKVREFSLPAPTLIGVQVRDPLESYFRVAATVDANKYFELHSISGEKYVQNVGMGSGVITNLLNRVESGSSWPTLEPGLNDFSVITNNGTQEWELSYFERYGGL